MMADWDLSTDWDGPLLRALSELDVEAVKRETVVAVNAIVDSVATACGGRFYDYGENQNLEVQKAGFEQMKHFTRVAHVAVSGTKLPGSPQAATDCAYAVIYALPELGNRVSRYTQWDFFPDAGFFTEVYPSFGDTEVGLNCYLAQMTVWGGQCYRCNDMLATLARCDKREDVPRTLERMVLAFAGIHKFAHASQRTQEMAKSSFLMNGVDEEGLESYDPDPGVMLDKIAMEDYIVDGNPDAQLMFTLMAGARENAKATTTDERHLNEITMRWAYVYIKQMKIQCGYYRSLWRKWKLTFAACSRWMKFTGESIGMGRLHATCVDAYENGAY